MAHCWGPKSSKAVHWILWPDEATGSALQTGSRAVGWAMQLLVYSGWVPWSGGLKAVFSNGQSYKLVSLPGWNRRTGSKARKALSLWSWLKPTCTPSFLSEQGHWLCSVDNCLCLLYSPLNRCWWPELVVYIHLAMDLSHLSKIFMYSDINSLHVTDVKNIFPVYDCT